MIRLAFPVIAWRRDGVWLAEPLLAQGRLVGRGRDPVVAIEDLERVVFQAYKVMSPGEDAGLADLGWEPPDLTTPRVRLPLGAGKLQSDRDVLVGTFTQAGARYVVVPRLRRWFVVPDAAGWEEALVRAIVAWRRREEAEDEAPPEPWELRSDRVLPARFSLQPKRLPPLSPPGGGGLFAALFGRRTPSGPEAVDAIATTLTPVAAAVPDPLVDAVVAAITATPPVPFAVVGPAGVGRHTVVLDALARLHAAYEAEETARWHARLDSGRREAAPPPVRPPLLYHLDPQRIVTGMSVVGEWQRRLEAALRWFRDRRREQEHQPGGDVVLVDDPVGLARVGRSAGSDLVASVLIRTWIEQGAFPMGIIATPAQWDRLTELDRPFAELFRVIRAPLPGPAHVARVVNAVRARLEADDGELCVSADAMGRIFELEARFPSHLAAPGAQVARLRRVAEAHAHDDEVDAAAVEGVFANDAGLQRELVDDAVPLDDGALRARLAEALVDQPEAVDALAGVVHAVKSGLRPRGRPIASFLFVGPTGVGKTEAAKVLTRTLFTSDAALVRVDLNAYADPGAVHRLIGTGDGALTAPIRRRPFAVLLLDEVEKAHPAVHDLLLQLLDEGRVTDGEGRVTSFETTVVVLTSNVGAAEAAGGVGFGRDAADLAALYRGAVARAFRPELLNRLDRIVPFGHLGPDALRSVAELQLARLLARDGFRNRTALLDVAPDAIGRVAADAWDPRFGARGLKRALERRIVAGAAETLAGMPGDAPVRLVVRLEGDAVAFTVRPLAWAVARPPLAPIPDLPAAIAAMEAAITPRRPAGGLVARSPRPPDDPDHGEVLALVEELAALAERAEAPPEPIPDEVERALVRAGGARRSATRAASRGGYRSPRHDPDHVASLAHGGLRAALLDLVAPLGAPTRAEALEDDVRFARARLGALDGPAAAVVRLRPETRATGAWSAFREAFFAAWSKVATRAGGALVVRGDHAEVLGVGAVALIAHDAGLHWWVPPDAATLVASVTVDGAPERGAIVRAYAPAASPGDPGAVHDLRAEAIVPMRDLPDALAGWALVAHGEGA